MSCNPIHDRSLAKKRIQQFEKLAASAESDGQNRCRNLDAFECWILYAPDATGGIFTINGLITGGSPNFRRLKGLLITNLPPGNRAELIGTIPREEGLRMGCLNWDELNFS